MIETPSRAGALAVFAHPDDPEVGCGGTLARWAAAGAEVHLVIANRGDKGSADPTTDPDALAAARAEEVARAAEVLGLASVEHLGYPDGEIDNDAALRARLIEIIRRLRPDALVAPDPTAVFFGDSYVNHRDHRQLGLGGARLARAGRQPALRARGRAGAPGRARAARRHARGRRVGRHRRRARRQGGRGGLPREPARQRPVAVADDPRAARRRGGAAPPASPTPRRSAACASRRQVVGSRRARSSRAGSLRHSPMARSARIGTTPTPTAPTTAPSSAAPPASVVQSSPHWRSVKP